MLLYLDFCWYHAMGPDGAKKACANVMYLI